MITWFGDGLLSFIGGVLLSGVALAVLGGAIVLYGLQLFRRLPAWLATPAVGLCVAFGVGLLAYDAGGDQARVKAEIAGLKQSLAAARAVAERERDRASAAAVRAAEREKTLDEYEAELRAGVARACPSDPAYVERMRNIRIGRDAR